ncbi:MULTISPECIES: oxidoreductase [unclassified Micromonospora]|uniref:oxidoreductase n=1 Tax=unclassified Micromonospora TaxID=2617518 RepID=UPI003A8764C8
MTTDNKPTASAGHLTIGKKHVARLGFGAMQLPGPGSWGPPADKDAAIAVLRTAIELGVDYIDTAGFYGPHVANDLIREALHPYPDHVVIGTKVGVVRDEWRAWNAAASPEQLREQVEENLSRLGQNRLDLVYLRVGGDGLLFPDEVPFAESLEALAELHRKGLIRNLGLSGVTVEQLEQARSIAPIAAVQNRFHLIDRGSAEVLQICADNGIVFAPYFPLAAGMFRPDLDKSQIPPGMGLNDVQEATLDRIAKEHEATRPQVALAWLLAYSPATLVIPGTSSVAHLRENLASAELTLTPAEVDELTALAG